MKRILVFLLCFSAVLHAESLKPKNQIEKKEDPQRSSPSKVNEPNEPESGSRPAPTPVASRRKPVHRWFDSRVTILGGTVAANENFFDKRFSTIVLGAEYLFPLTPIGRRFMLYGNLGMVLSLSRLTLTQPATSFSHYYFFFPVEGVVRYAFTRELLVEGFGGFLLRPFEWDTRSTNDGGFHKVSGVSVFEPELGAGVLFAFSDSLYGHFRLSYQFLRLGIELVL